MVECEFALLNDENLQRLYIEEEERWIQMVWRKCLQNKKFQW